MTLEDDSAFLFSRAPCKATSPCRRTRGIRRSSPLGRRLATLLLVAPASLGIAAARPTAPIAVAPGGESETTLASACSSFHWAPSQSASSFELAVYAVEEDSRNGESELGLSPEIEPELSAVLPGATSSWTPPLDQCLKTGASYAWSLRAILVGGPTAWAAPLFFQVPEGPSPAEIAQALELLRELRRATSQTIVREAENDSVPQIDSGSLPEPPVAEHRTIQAGIILPTGPATFSGGGPASLRVAGEVRSVDSTGEPRLWGKGRPGAKIYGPDDGSGAFCSQGSIRFGLSEGMADWGSADSACPEGTWVCRLSEIEAAPKCNTVRPDTSSDLLDCDGESVDQPEAAHIGWLADHPAPSNGMGLVLYELDSEAVHPICVSGPVWCCLD